MTFIVHQITHFLFKRVLPVGVGISPGTAAAQANANEKANEKANAPSYTGIESFGRLVDLTPDRNNTGMPEGPNSV